MSQPVGCISQKIFKKNSTIHFKRLKNHKQFNDIQSAFTKLVLSYERRWLA